MNAAAGAPVIVSRPTAQLVDRARAAHFATEGWFDPLMLAEILTAGYNTSFELVGAFGAQRLMSTGGVALADARPSLTDAEIDPSIGLVQLPPGAGFDPGGIGKGCAADHLVEVALASGATWAIADIGGDVRVDGTELSFGEFQIDVADLEGETMCGIAMESGAAATSGTGRRRWRGPLDDERHHLLDPRTGRPADTDIAAATVLAAEAWWAEAAATAVVVAGSVRGTKLLDQLGLPALLIDVMGRVSLIGDIEEYIL